jgi:hypothetical protein
MACTFHAEMPIMAKKMILIDPWVLVNQKTYTPPDTIRANLWDLDQEIQCLGKRRFSAERQDIIISKNISTLHESSK